MMCKSSDEEEQSCDGATTVSKSRENAMEKMLMWFLDIK
jgi:hypothetical protein